MPSDHLPRLCSRLFCAMFACVCGALTLSPSLAHSQNNPTDDELSLYTSVALVTTSLVGTSVLFYTLEPEQSDALIFVSTCSTDFSDLILSTHELKLEAAVHFIDLNRDALAADLPLAHGPVLHQLLSLIDASSASHAHLLETHLQVSRRASLLDALYMLDAHDWLLLLLEHTA